MLKKIMKETWSHRGKKCVTGICFHETTSMLMQLSISSSSSTISPALSFWSFSTKRCSFCDVYHRSPLKLSGGYGNSLRQCLISGHLRCMLNFTSLSNYSWPILVVFNELGLVWWLISDQKVRNSVFWIRYICSIVLDGIEILLLIVGWTESVEGSGDDEQRVWGIWTPVLRAFC